MNAFSLSTLHEALDAPRDQRTEVQNLSIDAAARIMLDIYRAEAAKSPEPIGGNPGTADALADAALEVVKTCLNEDTFVPGGAVTFAVMELQVALFAYRSMQ